MKFRIGKSVFKRKVNDAEWSVGGRVVGRAYSDSYAGLRIRIRPDSDILVGFVSKSEFQKGSYPDHIQILS